MYLVCQIGSERLPPIHHEQQRQPSYGDPAHVAREIAWTRRLFNESGWQTLDVTDQAIEETTARITAIVGPPSASMKAASLAELE